MTLLILKLGGGKELLQPETQAQFCHDVAIHAKDNDIIIINGANSRLTTVQAERGITPRILTSERGEQSRYTDEQTLELLKEVYGAVNTELVTLLSKAGIQASGHFGSDESLIVARQHGKQRIVEDNKVKVIEGDLTGRIESVNTDKLYSLLADKQVVVLTPPAITADGTEVNVDGDKMAAAIAKALKADKLIFFSDTAGLLANIEDPKSTIHDIKASEADQYAKGRMKKKVLSATRAIIAGVGEVMFADGRRAMPLTDALTGAGTHVI